MGERDIPFLLELYENEYVKGEQHSKETKKRIRYESKRKNRHLILDELLTEATALQLTKDQIKIIRYLIDEFNTCFKDLHRRVSEETIILAFIFYVKMIDTPKIRIDSYRISTKHHLTNHVFETIVCRMLLQFMKKCPIRPYNDYSKDEHEILIKEGKR